MIFSTKIFFWKIPIIVNIENWLWKSILPFWQLLLNWPQDLIFFNELVVDFGPKGRPCKICDSVILIFSYHHTLVQWCYYLRNLNDLGFCSPCATKSLFLFATMGCIFVTLTNEEHMLWCLAEISLLDSLDHQKSHMYLIPCCPFLVNSYFILQMYHAKNFKMKQVTSPYFNFSVWYS